MDRFKSYRVYLWTFFLPGMEELRNDASRNDEGLLLLLLLLRDGGRLIIKSQRILDDLIGSFLFERERNKNNG